MSADGVPGRYGGHDRCLDAYSKNYGCDDCVWLKWHGELHGFPDINPYDFKKIQRKLISCINSNIGVQAIVFFFKLTFCTERFSHCA